MKKLTIRGVGKTMRREQGSTSVIVIITIVAIALVIGIVIHKSMQNKRFQEIQKSYSSCYQRLSLIEKALQKYASEHKGKYPVKLKDLVPNYIKSIPECPRAGHDTYSSSYISIDEPPLYYLYCSGNNHSGPTDTPQVLSDLGYLPEDCDNPMTIVYENGRMREIMEMMVKSNQLMGKKEYKKAIETLKKLLKIQKTKREELYYRLAGAYFFDGDDKDAISALNDGIAIKFELEEWLALQDNIFEEGNVEQICKILHKYYKKAPRDMSCMILLAQFQEEMGNSRDAMKEYEASLKSGAAAHWGPIVELYCQGQLQRLQGNKQEAMDTLMGIREVQTQNLPVENYICRLSEEYIKKLRETEER